MEERRFANSRNWWGSRPVEHRLGFPPAEAAREWGWCWDLMNRVARDCAACG